MSNLYKLNSMLEISVKKGDLEQILLQWDQGDKKKMDKVMRESAKYNHLYVVKHLFSKHKASPEMAFKGASEGGHFEIMEMFMDKVSLELKGLCLGKVSELGRRDLVDLLLDNDCPHWWELALSSASKNNHVDLFYYLLEKAEEEEKELGWKSLLKSSVQGGSRDLIKLCCSKTNN
jgi:hypothetical protein